MHLTVQIAGALILINVVYLLIQRLQADALNAKKSALLAEVATLKREAARLNAPSTYAKAAKLQRSAAAKEKELASLCGQPTVSTLHARVGTVLTALQVFLAVAAAIKFWNVPLASLPPSWLWPLNRLLAAPHTTPFAALGLIAAGPYCYMCVRASRAVAEALLPVKSGG